MRALMEIKFAWPNQQHPVREPVRISFWTIHSDSIVTALATHHWHTILEKRPQVGCVFLKAFDTIPHQTLLNKLQLFRVSATILKELHM